MKAIKLYAKTNARYMCMICGHEICTTKTDSIRHKNTTITDIPATITCDNMMCEQSYVIEHLVDEGTDSPHIIHYHSTKRERYLTRCPVCAKQLFRARLEIKSIIIGRGEEGEDLEVRCRLCKNELSLII